MAKNPNKIRAKRVASDYVIDIIMFWFLSLRCTRS